MSATRLYLTTTVEEQWHLVVAPWLSRQSTLAWRSERPTVVLTPSRTEAFYFRGRLLQEGGSLLGVHFWTPSDARQFLVRSGLPGLSELNLAGQQLIARACAEKLSAGQKEADATLTSVMRDPDAFLRAYDLLVGAGSDPSTEGAPYGRKLASAFTKELARIRQATQAGLHRELRKWIEDTSEIQIANLLVAGFNASHWPLWDLLKAAVASAEEATIALTNPRAHFGEKIDLLWIGSWEEWLKTPAEWPPAREQASRTPFATLAASYEGEATSALPEAPVTYLVAADFSSQTRGIVLQTLRYLEDDSCTRLGLVFPEANGLAIAVADELQRLGIPFDDGTGSIRPGPFEKRFCQGWIALQEEPSAGNFLYWIRACEAEQVSFGAGEPVITTREIARIIDAALGETLVDDLDFLARHLESKAKRDPREVQVSRLLQDRAQLPAEAPFDWYLALTKQTFALYGWTRVLECISSSPWLEKWTTKISRRTFLGWLRAAADSRTRVRGVNRNHFYGKVHLVIYARMTGQAWSHLILTGLNEGVWPRFHEAGAFGSRHELALLNARARGENRRVQAQGAQGEGHDAVLPGRGYCLLPLDRRDLALRDLCAVLEVTTDGLCLASMTNERGRSLLPSDFFAHAYQKTTGRGLDEKEYRQLAKATTLWCEEHQDLFAPKSSGETSDIRQTGTARLARLDAKMPFGRYEFSFAELPPHPIQLSCKDWEAAWNHPASIWLSDIVGAGQWPEGDLAWPRAIGTWVHRWMKQALDACRKDHRVEDLMSHLRGAANRERAEMQAHAQRLGLELVPWWGQVHQQARSIVLQLGETLLPQLSEPFFSEYRLPNNLLIALPGDDRADFLLRGRLDLVVVEAVPASISREADSFKGDTCWVIDFKTGSAKGLGEKEVLRGRGLQTVLYALALWKQGAASITLSLLCVGEPLKRQINLSSVLEMRGLFKSLHQFHHRGIFGMRPGMESAYGYNPTYPIATRPVPQEVLESKWILVHGEEANGSEAE